LRDWKVTFEAIALQKPALYQIITTKLNTS